MNLRYLAVIEEFKLSLVDQSFAIGFFQFEIITRRDVIVLVGINALEHVVLFETELHQFFQDHSINRYLRESNEYSTRDPWQINLCIPWMLSNIGHSIALLRISIQDALHHVFGVLGDVFWHFKVAREDLLVKIACVCIFKWQVSADESKQDDST